MEMNNGASASQTGLSPSVQPVPVSPPDGASIPSAVKLENDKSLLNRLTEKDVERAGAMESVMVRAGLLLDILNAFEEVERALRIRIWNECKAKGVPDAVAYRRINEEVAAAYASAIEARSDETRHAAQPEGRERGGEAETP